MNFVIGVTFLVFTISFGFALFYILSFFKKEGLISDSSQSIINVLFQIDKFWLANLKILFGKNSSVLLRTCSLIILMWTIILPIGMFCYAVMEILQM